MSTDKTTVRRAEPKHPHEPQPRKSRRARVTVWYDSCPMTGSYGPASLIVWVQQLYEYLHGVPSTVEYQRAR